MVQPLEASRGQAAIGTGPSLVIDLHLLGLYTANEKEEDAPPSGLSERDPGPAFKYFLPASVSPGYDSFEGNSANQF
jgi:hypothetical protein